MPNTLTNQHYFESIHKGAAPNPLDPNLFTADDIAAYMLIDSVAISSATSKAVSTVNAAAPDSSSISTASSKASSAGSQGSVADSKAVSGSGNTSVADSKAISVSGNTSIADSKAVSVATATPTLTIVANSQSVSTADSKAVSVAATSASTSQAVSTADSKAVSVSVTTPSGRTVATLSAYIANNAAFHVMDYAPVGYVPGVTDATTMIQNALNAAGIGGQVVLPAGVLLYSSTLTVPVAVSVRGAGMDSTILRYTAATGDGMSSTGAAAVKHVLRDFTIEAQTASTGTALNVVNLSDSELANLRLRKFNVGLGMTSSIVNRIVGVRCDNNTLDGFNLGLDVNSNVFLGCVATFNGRAGYYILGARACQLYACDSENNAYGVIVTAAAGLRTSSVSIGFGSYFEGNTVQEILVTSQDVGVTKPQGTAIRDVYFNPLTVNTTDAVVVKYADGVDIENNVVDNLNGKAYSHGLLLDANGVTTNVRYHEGKDRATSPPFVYANHTGFIQWAGSQSLLVATEAGILAGQAVEVGQTVQVTLTAARLIATPPLATWKNGQAITYVIIQDGTGSWAVTWSGSFKQAWTNTGNAASKRSTITYVCDGTNWNQVGAQSPWI